MSNFSLYIRSIDEDLSNEENLRCKIKVFYLQCSVDIDDMKQRSSSVITQFRFSLITIFCKHLNNILDNSYEITSEHIIKDKLSSLLFENWEKTKHSPCSPLSWQDSYTALLYAIARYCSLGTQSPWLSLMMPGVCIESLSENYPDLSSMNLVDICQKFVLSKDGCYLIPVKILSTIELGTPIPKLPQYYLDISSKKAESNAYLCDEDVASLEQHSQITSKIFSIAQQYQQLISDPIAQSFQGLLQRLIKTLEHISVERHGQEYHAAEGSYSDISSFSETYVEILKEHGQQIPETLKETLKAVFNTLSNNEAHAHARNVDPSAICASALKESLIKCLIDPACQQALIGIESPSNQKQLTALYEEFQSLKKSLLAKNYAGNQKNDIDLNFLSRTGLSLQLTESTIPYIIKALTDISLYNIFNYGSCYYNFVCNILSEGLLKNILLTSNPKQIAAFSRIFSSSFFDREVITNLEQLQSNLDYLQEYPSKAQAFLANSNCLLSAIFKASTTENVLDFLSRLPAYQLTVVLKELWPSLGIKSLCSNMQQFSHWINFFSQDDTHKKVFIDNCANLFEHVASDDPLFSLKALPENLHEHFLKLVFEISKILPTIIAKRPRVLKNLIDEKFIAMLSTLQQNQRLSLLILAFEKAPQGTGVCSSSSSSEYDDTQALISFINLFSALDVGQLIQNILLSTPAGCAQTLKDKIQGLLHPSLMQTVLDQEATQTHFQKLLVPVFSSPLRLSDPEQSGNFLPLEHQPESDRELSSFLSESGLLEDEEPLEFIHTLDAKNSLSERPTTPVKPLTFEQDLQHSSNQKRSLEINGSIELPTRKIVRKSSSNKGLSHRPH